MHLVEADLLDAIDRGRIEGATLDVASVEPLPDAHPFWNHPSILITPHVAGAAIPQTAGVNNAANNRKTLAGERPRQLFQTEPSYRRPTSPTEVSNRANT